MRNAQAFAPRGQKTMLSDALRQVFTQLDHPNASQTMRHVADQLHDRWPKLGAFIVENEADVLAYMTCWRPMTNSTHPDRHRSRVIRVATSI